MADVEQLLAEFANEFREAGEADPRPYLRRAQGAERLELAALIDAFIEAAPRRAFDPEGYRGSASERAVERLRGVVEPTGESLPDLLPRLRHERKLKRSELASRLAAALGFGEREPKVAHYYHQLEQGLLPPTGVTDRVFAALGSVLDESAERLRAAAGTSSDAGQGSPAQPAFARVSSPDAFFEGEGDEERAPAPADEEWDEVDEAFRGR